MNESKPPKTNVYCPACGGFMFSFTLASEDFTVGGIGKIENFRCPNRRCAHQAMVLLGVADKDKRGDVKKIEDEMKDQIVRQ